MRTRPTESNSGDSSQGAEEVAGGERGDVPAHRLDPEEGAEGVSEGEEERVVEERLADEEREAQDGAPGVQS